MPVDYTSDSFAETLAGGLARLSALEGPYLVHCTEGKDRAGFASALLECLSLRAKCFSHVHAAGKTIKTYFAPAGAKLLRRAFLTVCRRRPGRCRTHP